MLYVRDLAGNTDDCSAQIVNLDPPMQSSSPRTEAMITRAPIYESFSALVLMPVGLHFTTHLYLSEVYAPYSMCAPWVSIEVGPRANSLSQCDREFALGPTSTFHASLI